MKWHYRSFVLNPFMPSGLFYFGQVHFLYKGCLVSFYYCHVLRKYLNLMPTVQTLIRRSVLRRLIWVYNVCQCPFYATLGLYCLFYNSVTSPLFLSNSKIQICLKFLQFCENNVLFRRKLFLVFETVQRYVQIGMIKCSNANASETDLLSPSRD